MTRAYNSEKNLDVRVRISAELRGRLDRRLAREQRTNPALSMSDLCRDALANFVGIDAPKLSKPTVVKMEPIEPMAEMDAERFVAPHLVQADGSCLGGCDVDLDALCSIGPTDERRIGKKRRR